MKRTNVKKDPFIIFILSLKVLVMSYGAYVFVTGAETTFQAGMRLAAIVLASYVAILLGTRLAQTFTSTELTQKQRDKTIFSVSIAVLGTLTLLAITFVTAAVTGTGAFTRLALVMLIAYFGGRAAIRSIGAENVYQFMARRGLHLYFMRPAPAVTDAKGNPIEDAVVIEEIKPSQA